MLLMRKAENEVVPLFEFAKKSNQHELSTVCSNFQSSSSRLVRWIVPYLLPLIARYQRVVMHDPPTTTKYRLGSWLGSKIAARSDVAIIHKEDTAPSRSIGDTKL